MNAEPITLESLAAEVQQLRAELAELRAEVAGPSPRGSLREIQRASAAPAALPPLVRLPSASLRDTAATLDRLAGRGRGVTRTTAELARTLGVKERAVQQRLENLRNLGLVRSETDYDLRSRRRIVLLWAQSRPRTQAARPRRSIPSEVPA